MPCMLQFKGQPEDVLKLKKLLSPAGIKSGKENVQPPTKKRKIDLDPTVIDDYGKTSKDEDQGESNIWLSDPFSHIVLSQRDRNTLTTGGWLNDNHINLAQELLKRQFKNLSGFQSTLLLSKLKEPLPATGTLQVLHSRGNHWIVASTLGCSAGEVSVFDSLYPSVDEGTLGLLKQLFGVHIKVKMESCPKQADVSDCGLFAIANCTTLAYGGHSNSARFNQDAMRQHLLNCLESFYFIPFPKSE